MRLLVIDNTQYVEFARTLGRSGLFDSVGYFAPWQEDTPFVQEASVGCGFPEIEREFDLFECLDEYDAYAFPALYWDGMQHWLRQQGRPVWGAGASENLERNRWLLIQTMRQLGLPVSPSALVVADKLRSNIHNGDVVKISQWRGDTETVKHEGDWSWWYQLMNEWGPMRSKIQVVVQDPIEGDHCEPGFDLLIVRGKPCSTLGVGYEVKDGGYIEKNMSTMKMPSHFKQVYEAVLKMIRPDYSNFLSTEMLGKYLLDITCRIPQPPGDLKLYIWPNLPGVIEGHLRGNTVGLGRLQHEWGVQLIAHNNNPKNYCRFGKIDASIQPHIYFNRAVQIDGEIWTVPWKDKSVQDWVDAASVCASGKTPEEAINEAQRVVDEFHLPNGVLIDPSTKDHLMQALEDGEEEGIYLL